MRAASTALAAALACLLAAAAAQDCVTKGAALQAACSRFTSLAAENQKLEGVPDAELEQAASSAAVKPDAGCCSAIKDFAGTDPATCACDATVTALAQSQGATGKDLLFLTRYAAVSCKGEGVTFTGAARGATCPAASG